MSNSPFHSPADLSDERAAELADILDERAGEDMQVRLRRRLAELVRLRPGDHAVELGCGTGHLLIDLAEAAGPQGRVLGVEPQHVLADRARSRVAANPAVTVHTGPAQDLPLTDASADAVVAQTVLIHLEPPVLDAVLAEARRVLRPGGRFVSADQDVGTRVVDHPDEETTRKLIAFEYELFGNGWLGRRLPRLLRGAGFRVESVEVHPFLSFKPEGFTFNRSGRLVDIAVDGGAITREAGARWLAALHELAAEGSFLAGVSYFVTTAELATE